MKQQSSAAKRLSLDPLLLGFYAWLLTVAVPSFSSNAPLSSRILSCLALASLTLAWIAAGRYLIVSDLLASAGYMGLCLGTWVTLGHPRLTANLAELRTLLGAVAWALFGVAWVRARYAVTLSASLGSGDSQGFATRPRRRAVGGVAHIVVSIVLVAATFLRLGMPTGNGRGVLTTAIAIAWALWLFATAGTLAERLEQKPRGIGLRLIAERAIVLAILLTGAGVVLGALLKQ